MTIGRATDGSCDIVIGRGFDHWRAVSLHHARVDRVGDDRIIVDLDSRNGVYVNGQRTGENLLFDGCRVHLAQEEFTYHTNETR